MKNWIIIFFLPLFSSAQTSVEKSWIRINQLGYATNGTKVAVWCSKEPVLLQQWELREVSTNQLAASGSAGQSFGQYGPFQQTYRLNFSFFKKPGRYVLKAGGAVSPEFVIGEDVYKGAADFCLHYMRQQRTGFNPFLKDSCHTHDGYVLYGEKAGIKDSTYVDVVGGWHDASDYLQYSSTSANATFHLLMAYRDFPQVFTDKKQSNGLDGKNGMADVLDEAKWGLDWLVKMHPRDDWMFNQIGDDRDHMGMRIPKEDTNFYGKGLERPVYFLSGEPQQRGKFMNNTTGRSSTAAKFSSAFALGAQIFNSLDYKYAKSLVIKSETAMNFGDRLQGVTQTASVKSPYIYAEENSNDDMELALSQLSNLHNGYTLFEKTDTVFRNYYRREAYYYARKEPVTPWLGKDTAKHYQWYPFINLGHYELAKQLQGKQRDIITGFYKDGIQRVWEKAKQNAFYRGIPFIWCSNNLTVAFTQQCFWYKDLTGDKQFNELEQANFDWLFGCNPWGTSMVYGLPARGDTPVDPHSAFTHLENYPIDGGLVDGPVYGSIYKNLIGIQLKDADEYAAFQSDLAVYHDDYGDYSTNEPTMDGTASLIYLLAAKEVEAASGLIYRHGAIIRGDTTVRKIALVFTGDEFADGGDLIAAALKKEKIKASFFFTGRFYRNPQFHKLIKKLKAAKNYLGAHSNNHLLYCDWNDRRKLLVSNDEFTNDLSANYRQMEKFGIAKKEAPYFLPPYEWYNDTIAAWTTERGLQLINFTPGTRSTADYTTPSDKNYRDSETIYQSILQQEQATAAGLNGYILLLHIGTDSRRTDKFYQRLPELIHYLHNKGYQFQRVDELLATD